MKFLAILKDSLREAIDSKVLYVMVGFSLVVILLVGSISYRPMPAKDAFPAMVEDFRFDGQGGFDHRKDARLNFSQGSVTDIQQLNESEQPFLGEYQFTFQGTWRLFNPHAAAEVAVDKDGNEIAFSEAFAEAYVKKHFELHDIEILSIKPVGEKAAPMSATFDIQARGTSVGRSWLHKTTIFFGALDLPFPATLGRIVYTIEDKIVNGFGGWIAILVSTIITAFFIPNMLHKGTVDLLLAKPIGRIPLLLYKYIGGLTFMFLNATVAVGGIWIVMGLRTGIWAPGFLVSIPVLTFFFAILYSISTLMGVLTRSAVIAILITCVMWVLFYVVGLSYTVVGVLRKDPQLSKDMPEWVSTTVNSIHAVTPRTSDLDYLITRSLTSSLLSEAEIRRNHLDLLPDFSWTESLGVSAAFILLMLSLACWRFWARDY